MRVLNRLRHRDDGAAAVETALVLGFLLVLALGIVETTFLMVNHLAVGNATREGARAGVAVGTESGGDDVVIDIVEQALCSMVSGAPTKVIFFEPDANGQVQGHPYDGSDLDFNVLDTGAARVYTPAGTRTCSDGGTTVNFGLSIGTWDYSQRDNELPSLDDFGVLVLYDHDDMTDFLPFMDRTDIPESTVMRLEPDISQ